MEPAIGGGFEATLNIPNSISVGYGLNLSVSAIGDNNIDAINNVSINSIVFSTSISINITSIITMIISIIVVCRKWPRSFVHCALGCGPRCLGRSVREVALWRHPPWVDGGLGASRVRAFRV